VAVAPLGIEQGVRDGLLDGLVGPLSLGGLARSAGTLVELSNLPGHELDQVGTTRCPARAFADGHELVALGHLCHNYLARSTFPWKAGFCLPLSFLDNSL